MYKLLLVDDEPLIHKGFKYIVNWEEYGIEIAAHAKNGIEALEIVETTMINIIITDVRMPDMDGIGLIKCIRERKLPIKCIVLSGYDDFIYVKEAINLGIENYLLKPVNVEELKSTLQNTIYKIENEFYKQIEAREGLNILKNNLLNRWVKGDIEMAELKNRASLLGIRLDCDGFQAAILKALQTNEEHISKIKKKSLLRFAIQNICEEILSSKFAVTTFCDLNGDIIVIFHHSNFNRNQDEIHGCLFLVSNKINEFLHTKVFITVGSSENEFQNLHLSYTHANKLQEYGLVTPPTRIMFHEDIAKDTQLNPLHFKINLNALSQYIKTKNKFAAIQFIQSTFHQLMIAEGLTPSQLHNITFQMLFTIINGIKTIEGTSDVFFDNYKSMFRNVFEMNSLQSIEHYLETIVSTSISLLESELDKFSPILHRTLIYVREHLTSELSLKTIASEFNISPAYLGYLFTKEIGDTFTNYLNKIRIEQAKELLLHTSLKTKEISDKVGYANANYFSIIFRKITGMSPSDYKGK